MTNQEVVELVRRLDAAYVEAERSGKPEDWSTYDALKDAVDAAIGLDCPGTTSVPAPRREGRAA